MQPHPKEAKETFFQRVYGSIFLVLLLAGLGGAVCVWMAKAQLAHLDYQDREYQDKGRKVPEYHRLFELRLFQRLGIRDWKLQFGIGAAVGAGGALLWIRNFNKREKNREDAA
jgi:hypothetical protein